MANGRSTAAGLRPFDSFFELLKQLFGFVQTSGLDQISGSNLADITNLVSTVYLIILSSSIGLA